MKRIVFEPPVGIYVGKLGRVRTINSLHDAADCLMSETWPSHRGAAFEEAILTLIAASEGCVDAARARQAFSRAAAEAGILVDRKLMLH
jgi:hypothetical protein